MNVEVIQKFSDEPSPALIASVAIATGALVANLYYAQPLIEIIAREVGIPPRLAGSATSITQFGYGIGLFFLVSLADLVENKRLVLINLGLAVMALVWAATARTALSFFISSFFVGLCSTGAQILVPYISNLVPDDKRGGIIGNVMAGLLAGIMLSRPVALLISAHFGWRGVFLWSASLVSVVGLTLLCLMPSRYPPSGKHYFQILRSTIDLFRETPILRKRSLYQSLMFCVFNMFWTAAPIMLADRFGLNEHGIALFALAGAGGALAAPFAGRLADRGLTREMTVGAIAALGLSSLFAGVTANLHWLAALAVLTVVFDGAVQTNQITSQRMVFSGPAETRGRRNAIFMTINFIGGAIGSMLGSLTYLSYGWTLTAGTCTIICGLLFIIFVLND